MLQEYDGRVRLVFKDRPLAMHTLARAAHEAARCAGAAGKYWAYHDRLFAAQPAFRRSDLLTYAAELGLVTRVVPDAQIFATAMETAKQLAAKPGGALRASKRLLKQGFIDQVRAAIKLENGEFGERLRSSEAKEAFSAFLEKRPPNFTRATTPAVAE